MEEEEEEKEEEGGLEGVLALMIRRSSPREPNSRTHVRALGDQTQNRRLQRLRQAKALQSSPHMLQCLLQAGSSMSGWGRTSGKEVQEDLQRLRHQQLQLPEHTPRQAWTSNL